LLGCEVDAGNFGVAALGYSLVRWLREAEPDCEITFQVPGRTEPLRLETPDGGLELGSLPLHYSKALRDRFGTRRYRKLRAFERTLPARIRSRVSLGSRQLASLAEADVAIDVSAGDSFTEIYGPFGFDMQCAIKEFVLDLGLPLVLSPQTIGPFVTDEGRHRARRILERSALVATRDAFGLDELRVLMGGELDERFHLCPDMAFGLEPVGSWAANTSRNGSTRRPLIGVNVSGLLYGQPDRFGIKSDHAELIRRIIEMFLEETDSQILLVPHVRTEDENACEEAARSIPIWGADRVSVLRGSGSAPQVKQVIGCCDFFVGARMHACIAALSQSVPTAALAYSKKVAGVMGKLGVPEATVELRSLGIPEALDSIHALYEDRVRLRHTLGTCLPVVQDELRDFFRNKLPEALEKRCVAVR
jgi:polysaccharide pyruvyl transferase WcaK-like protein